MKLHYIEKESAVYCWDANELIPIWDEHTPDRPLLVAKRGSNYLSDFKFELLGYKEDKPIYRIRIRKVK